MGTIKQGILGGFSGKVGGLVGTSWKGIAVVKTLPQSVANPQTAGQVVQRGKFSNVVAVAVVLLSTIIKPLWDRFAQKMSGYNAFCSANVDLFTSNYPSPAADFILSSGKMAATTIKTVTAVNGTKAVTITWDDDSNQGYKLGTDEAYAIVFDITNGNIGMIGGDDARSGGSTEITFPVNLVTGHTLQVYLAFRRADGTVVSNTGYLQKVVTA